MQLITGSIQQADRQRRPRAVQQPLCRLPGPGVQKAAGCQPGGNAQQAVQPHMRPLAQVGMEIGTEPAGRGLGHILLLELLRQLGGQCIGLLPRLGGQHKNDRHNAQHHGQKNPFFHAARLPSGLLLPVKVHGCRAKILRSPGGSAPGRTGSSWRGLRRQTPPCAAGRCAWLRSFPAASNRARRCRRRRG